MSVNTNDPRVLRTRQLLQTALLELMQEKPFQAISVTDLTRRATLNRATFYLHYLDKFDLLAQSARDTFMAVIHERLPDWDAFHVEDIQLLTQATCEYLDGFLKGCAPANKPYEPLIEAELQRVLYDYICGWLDGETGHSPDTLPVETCATMVSSTVLHMSLKWSRGETAYERDEVVKQVYTTVTQGIFQTIPAARQ